MKLYRDYFKRAIDVAASGCGLLVLSPVLAVVTVWLHFANKGAGAFFFQERPGKDGKIFRMVTDIRWRTALAANGRPLVASRYEQSYVRRSLLDFYHEILQDLQ